MEKASSQMSDASIIILIWRVIQNMRNRGDGNTIDCLLNQEKLLHLTLMTLEKKSLKAPPFDLTEEVVAFVRKVNKLTMETFEKEEEEGRENIFIKAIDLLMTKSLGKYITPLKVLGELKVLTFNNLACIYKRKKKFTLALRSVSFALQIQQALVQNQTNGDKHNIVTTYLNKAAILSQMNKHQKAIDQINKGLKYLTNLQKQSSLSQSSPPSSPSPPLPTQPQSQKPSTSQQRKYYCAYMKMIIFYNLGAQNQHLHMKQSAQTCYRRGKAIADAINNDIMKKKFAEILTKLNA